jgi:prepilin-type N-terminal cleavage/methylation domain-containing protein
MFTRLHRTDRLGRRGFTMLEVMLAIGIFGFVMVAIYSCWSSIMRGTRIGLTAAAEVQRTRIAIRSLEEALGGAVMYSDNPIYYGFYADTAGDFAYLSFVARLPESFPGSGLFPGQTMRRVTFRVDDKRNLLLTQSTLLDVSEAPYTITLAPKTAVFALEFYNPRMNEWIPEWIATNALPSLVRVAMDFGDKKKDSVTIRSIPLTAFAISRGMAAAQGQPQVPPGANPGMQAGSGAGDQRGPADRRNRGNEAIRVNRGSGSGGSRGGGMPSAGFLGGGGFGDIYSGPRPQPPGLPPSFQTPRAPLPGGAFGPRNPVFPPMPGG